MSCCLSTGTGAEAALSFTNRHTGYRHSFTAPTALLVQRLRTSVRRQDGCASSGLHH
jgi:hypothetical protein